MVGEADTRPFAEATAPVPAFVAELAPNESRRIAIDSQVTAAAGGELAERLLDAATRVLAEQRLGELTIRRVAEQTDSSTMDVSRRFSLEALYRRLFGELAEALRSVPATADPVADIRALAAAHRRFALARLQRYAFIFADPLPAFAPDSDPRTETVQTTFVLLLDAIRRTGWGADTATRST